MVIHQAVSVIQSLEGQVRGERSFLLFAFLTYAFFDNAVWVGACLPCLVALILCYFMFMLIFGDFLVL